MSATAMPSVSWEALIKGTREAFSSDHVEVDTMKNLMAAYKSSESDWMRFKFESDRYVKSLS